MNKIRLTYRLTKELYKKICEDAEKRNISVNALINIILWDYYEKRGKEEERGREDEGRGE